MKKKKYILQNTPKKIDLLNKLANKKNLRNSFENEIDILWNTYANEKTNFYF